MPTIYKGVKVPVGTDYASGPTLATDMVDSFPDGDFYKALDGGTAGPFRMFPDVTTMNGWAAPLGSLAFVLANGGLYGRINNTATPPTPIWDQLVTASTTPPYVPLGLVHNFDGSLVVQAPAIGAGVDYLLHNTPSIGTIHTGRTVAMRFSFRALLADATKPTGLEVRTRFNPGVPQDVNAGIVACYDAQTTFTGITYTKYTGATKAASAQIYVKNAGSYTVSVRDLTFQVAEI